MKFRIEAFPAHDVPEEPVIAEGVDRVSFIDGDSHGPMGNFGITTKFEIGEKVGFVSSPNVTLATVERTE